MNHTAILSHQSCQHHLPEGEAALIQFLALMTILHSSVRCSAMSWTLTISIRINVHLHVGEIKK